MLQPGGLLPDGIGVLAVDAGETEIKHHGVAATESLGEVDLGARGELDRIAAGNLRGGDIAGESAVAVHGRVEESG